MVEGGVTLLGEGRTSSSADIVSNGGDISFEEISSNGRMDT